jgi:hypothetical protein
MFEPSIHVWRESIFARVAARSVSAVVTECDGLGQCGVQPEGACDGNSNLRNLQRVCQACSLVIVGEDEDLCLSSQSAKSWGVQNSIAITLEARSPRIGFLLDKSVAGSVGSSGEGTQ